MTAEVAILDSDTLSLLSRGEARVVERARHYLERHGRLTITSVTVFERLRGYHAALRAGKPYQQQLQSFEALIASSIVLSFDETSARLAGRIWAALPRKARRPLGDILIAAIACAHQRPLVTRNRRHFTPISKLPSARLRLLDWSAPR